MEYLNLIAMKSVITKLIIMFCFCGGIFGVIFVTSVLAEKIIKLKNRAVKTAPHSK